MTKVRLNLENLPSGAYASPASEMYTAPPYFDQVYPRNVQADKGLRRARFSRYEVDPREPYNQSMLLHTSLISGRPGYDFSNPLAWIGRIRQQPRPSLQPNYGGAMQNGEGIANNISASAGLIRKTGGAGWG